MPTWKNLSCVVPVSIPTRQGTYSFQLIRIILLTTLEFSPSRWRIDSRIPDRDDYDVSTYNPYLHSQVYLPHEGETKLAKVKSRKRDSDGGNLIGRAAANPIQDTQEYVLVEIEGGTTEGRYSANIISKNMISRIDSDGNQEPLLRQLVDHHRKKSDAIPKDKAAYIKVGGKKVLQRTTKGWDLCIEWADGRADYMGTSSSLERAEPGRSR